MRRPFSLRWWVACGLRSPRESSPLCSRSRCSRPACSRQSRCSRRRCGRNPYGHRAEHPGSRRCPPACSQESTSQREGPTGPARSPRPAPQPSPAKWRLPRGGCLSRLRRPFVRRAPCPPNSGRLSDRRARRSRPRPRFLQLARSRPLVRPVRRYPGPRRPAKLGPRPPWRRRPAVPARPSRPFLALPSRRAGPLRPSAPPARSDLRGLQASLAGLPRAGCLGSGRVAVRASARAGRLSSARTSQRPSPGSRLPQ